MTARVGRHLPRGWGDLFFQLGLWLGFALVYELASNPYAAMPSVHAADALIIGFALATLVRSRWLSALWTLWPTWVWFSVMATGNHFWLDVAAGIAVALVAGTMVAWAHNRRLATAPCLYCDRRW